MNEDEIADGLGYIAPPDSFLSGRVKPDYTENDDEQRTLHIQNQRSKKAKGGGDKGVGSGPSSSTVSS